MRDIVAGAVALRLVDAEDGYGDVKNVTHTIQGYEAIGIAGVLLEDQSREGKQPGAAAARNVVPTELMTQKLKAAMAARKSSEFVIIGRTDAFGALGMDEALRRAEHFLRVGADGVFVAGLKTPEDYARVGKALKGSWNAAAIFEGTTTPWLTPRELHNMGFSQIAYPNILIGRVAKAIESGLDRLRKLAAGDENAFMTGGQELGLKSLAEPSISRSGTRSRASSPEWPRIGPCAGCFKTPPLPLRALRPRYTARVVPELPACRGNERQAASARRRPHSWRRQSAHDACFAGAFDTERVGLSGDVVTFE